ncbi:hypothetical protein [Dyella monticola]|uniref:hypothetical protein n=1 Tax=Dyella monticola TaxID=1927958 RepID=UPI0011C02A03|nr:hypothetical protein [Dyella monticola]
MTEIKNGPFKVDVRVQEINYSGSQNIDVCVANSDNKIFPDKKVQCFLNGYDFDGLSIKWLSPRVIKVSFRSGRVTGFTNSAFVYSNGTIPEEFHIILCEGCGN